MTGPTSDLSGVLEENERLRGRVRDLAAASSLPARWLGLRPTDIATPLATMVGRLLHADLVYVRLVDPANGAIAEAGDRGSLADGAEGTRQVREALDTWLAGPETEGVLKVPWSASGEVLRLARAPVGADPGAGLLVVGARRAGFPEEIDRVLLGVVCHQVAIILEARQRLDEQAAPARAEAARAEREALDQELAAANRDLQRRTAEIQTLLEVIPIGVAVAHDPDCRSITGNPAFERMLGMPRGTNLSKSAPPGEVPPFALYRGGRALSSDELPMQMAAARGAGVSNVEVDVVWADGTVRKLLEWAAPLFDEAGRVRGSLLAVVDITQREQAEAALRESDTRLRQAARAAKQAEEEQRFLAEASAVLASSLDYELTLASVARLAVFALADWCLVDVTEPDRTVRKVAVAHAEPAHEALARDLRRYPPDPGWPHPVSDVLASGQPALLGSVADEWLASHTRDERHLAILQAIAPRSAMILPLVARGQILGALTFLSTRQGRTYGPADLALAENLASRAAIAVDNARLYQEAQAATRAREAFLARASHELRTPLTSALGSMRLVKRALNGSFPERPDALIDLANRNLDAMLALVNGLLDASKLAADAERLEAAAVPLATLLERSLEQVEPQAREAGVAVALALPPRLAVLGDPDRLEQVFVNLLVNAVRHSVAGSRVRVEAEREAGQVAVRISDEGEGIAREDLERIFEPFVQAHRSGGRRGRGTGLGLAICRQIVTLHGGRIFAESAGPGRGSTFVVVLPEAAQGEDLRPNAPVIE